MSDAPFLEIVFHMVNGEMLKYCCSEQTAAQELIARVNPLGFFTKKQLVISSDDSTTRIILDDVCCIEFNTSLDLKKWPFPSHIENIMTLSKDKFLNAIETELEEPEVIADPGERARPISLFLKLLMRDGLESYLQFFAEALKPIERTELARVVRDLTGFHAVKSEGGAILFNFTNVVASITYPTALLASQDAWELKNTNS